MAFTYDLDHATASLAIVSEIRLEIPDIVVNEGPFLDKRNFQDDELTHLYEREGKIVGRAAAAALEILARHWAGLAGQHKEGPVSNWHQQAREYREQAKMMRAQYGYTKRASILVHGRPNKKDDDGDYA